MHVPRRLLLVLTAIAVVVAACAGFYVVSRESPGAAMSRLYVDIGLLITLVLIVLGSAGAKPHLLTELVEALRALSHGSHERRLDPSEYGTLEEVARAYNEAAAALSEMDDPNLGPVQVKSRRARGSQPPKSRNGSASPARTKSKSSAERDSALSDHPELGEVRRIAPTKVAPTKDGDRRAPVPAKADNDDVANPVKKSAEKAAEEAAKRKIEKSVEKSVEKRVAAPAAKNDDKPPQARAPETSADEPALESPLDDESPTILEPAQHEVEDLGDETVLPEDAAAPPSPAPAKTADYEKPSKNAAGDEGANGKNGAPVYPTRSELRALFDEFVAQKQKVHEDTSELDFESFADTLEDESRRLV